VLENPVSPGLNVIFVLNASGMMANGENLTGYTSM
jgi:hypothetical protein